MNNNIIWPIEVGQKEIDLDLSRMRLLLTRLGNPELRLPPVIHVAGTNGKGSTIAFMAALLHEKGKTTHRYISPHLIRFNERIIINDTEITDDFLNEVLSECRKHSTDIPALTFFEATTAAALLAFSRIKADYLLLETGMGGRLDATNIIDKPLASVITSISLDHLEFLGSTIKDIATEKAGIIKQAVPVIVANQPYKESLQVISTKASVLNAPLFTAEDFGSYNYSPPALHGSHQLHNAATAITTMKILGIYNDDNDDRIAINKAMSKAFWPARLQLLTEDPLPIWLDGAHNENGATSLATWLSSSGKKAIFVIAMLQNKDHKAVLQKLAPFAKGVIYSKISEEAKTADPTHLARILAGDIVENGRDAIEAAKSLAKERNADIIVICGSLYFAGEVMKIYQS